MDFKTFQAFWPPFSHAAPRIGSAAGPTRSIFESDWEGNYFPVIDGNHPVFIHEINATR